MEIFKVIAMLCQIHSGPSMHPDRTMEHQSKCHWYYAKCLKDSGLKTHHSKYDTMLNCITKQKANNSRK